MKNKNLIILGSVGVLYGLWRFVIKPKLAEKKSMEAVKNYELFDSQRELIASSLPQDFENPFSTPEQINDFT